MGQSFSGSTSAASPRLSKAQRTQAMQRMTQVTVQRVDALRPPASSSSTPPVVPRSADACSTSLTIAGQPSLDFDAAASIQVLDRFKECAARGGNPFVKDELVHLIVLLKIVFSDGNLPDGDTYARLRRNTTDELYGVARMLMYHPTVLARLAPHALTAGSSATTNAMVCSAPPRVEEVTDTTCGACTDRKEDDSAATSQKHPVGHPLLATQYSAAGRRDSGEAGKGHSHAAR